MSPESVHEAISRAAEHIRAGNGPYFLEIRTYRYKGHSVSDPAKYRTKEEVQAYQDRDPIKVTEDKIISGKIATAEEIQAIKDLIKAEVEDAVQFAENSPYPDASELYTDNYVESDYPYIKY
jgi:pyruvate dehydrogenase E1 component alpha subunit